MNTYLKAAMTTALLGSLSTYVTAKERAMEHMDSDGDGYISMEEFQPRGGQMLHRMDNNNDGAVSQEEFDLHQQMIQAHQEERMTRMKEHFQASDVNGDGTVTQEEARTAAFNRIDADADGYLSEAELQAAHPGRGGPHGQRKMARPGEPTI